MCCLAAFCRSSCRPHPTLHMLFASCKGLYHRDLPSQLSDGPGFIPDESTHCQRRRRGRIFNFRAYLSKLIYCQLVTVRVYAVPEMAGYCVQTFASTVSPMSRSLRLPANAALEAIPLRLNDLPRVDFGSC